LLLQASSFRSTDVVTTLKTVLQPDAATTTMTFSSEDQVSTSSRLQAVRVLKQGLNAWQVTQSVLTMLAG
jgi:hypothetical protein